ncbi:hypothetical protein MICA_1794 [Micavibrio aeruginosavorus ARL-13]|uniref:Uncharacterized protein n=1 Tax=Micavibrio aeruginosavorus (strain ARL-13) TaxID=856793 RepID=G2KSW0_MICAA|nr:hypothetical protein MICA_1794 [Micavibrio aeruginosavorus ARL-13]
MTRDTEGLDRDFPGLLDSRFHGNDRVVMYENPNKNAYFLHLKKLHQN